MNQVGAIQRIARAYPVFSPFVLASEGNRRYLKFLALAFSVFCLTSCQTISRHQFAQPARDWQTRNGQLLYRGAGTALIGEVFVRFSKAGEFELIFSKGPGVTLLALRQDDVFAEVKGALVRSGWSGPVEQAPKQLRGWLEIRDKLVRAQNQKTVRHVAGTETFLFHF